MYPQDLLRLYYSSVGQRDAWSNQAAKVDARVEDEWDSIYVDCQDGADVDTQDYSFDRGSGLTFSSMSDGVEGSALGRNGERSEWGSSSSAAAAGSLQSRHGGGRWRPSTGGTKSGGSRSALMAAMDALQAEEEEGRGGRELGRIDEEEEEEEEDSDEEEEDDEEEIIDCAIRGRWTFTNNDDPVRD